MNQPTDKPAQPPVCPIHQDRPMEFIQTFDGRDWFECGHATAGTNPRRCSCAIDLPAKPTTNKP